VGFLHLFDGFLRSFFFTADLLICLDDFGVMYQKKEEEINSRNNLNMQTI